MTDEPSIYSEIKQTRPFESPAEEAVVTLLRTADVVRRSIATAAASRDVTHQQYNVLRILRGAGPEGLPTLEIAERMIERTPGVTRLLDRLEKKGLVERERCPEDRRQVLCTVTEDGLETLADLDGPVLEAAEEAVGCLDERELETIVELLDRLRASQSPC